MKTSFWAVVGITILIPAGIVAAQSSSRSLQTLIEAERAFSHLSEDKGIREAFLFYLADDSVVFLPRPVPGRKAYEEAPADSPTLLTWEPAYAEVSPAGDLGYTTGPYQAKNRSNAAAPPRFGHYVSLWQKQPTGLWKVVLDIGIRHPQPGFKPLEVMTKKDARRPKRLIRVDKFRELNFLLKIEAEFAAKAAAEGILAAYLAYADDDIRIFRDGSLPSAGTDTLRQEFSGRTGSQTWEPVDGDVSRYGALGFIFGTAETKSGDPTDPPATSSYFRIWRKNPEGLWKIALDLAIPIPPEPEQQN
ncbi:MAG: nuclear transport factor 2 family protein [Candidatus Aminicenantales bacterium]